MGEVKENTKTKRNMVEVGKRDPKGNIPSSGARMAGGGVATIGVGWTAAAEGAAEGQGGAVRDGETQSRARKESC